MIDWLISLDWIRLWVFAFIGWAITKALYLIVLTIQVIRAKRGD